jgi:hypothetical protein
MCFSNHEKTWDVHKSKNASAPTASRASLTVPITAQTVEPTTTTTTLCLLLVASSSSVSIPRK